MEMANINRNDLLFNEYSKKITESINFWITKYDRLDRDIVYKILDGLIYGLRHLQTNDDIILIHIKILYSPFEKFRGESALFLANHGRAEGLDIILIKLLKKEDLYRAARALYNIREYDEAKAVFEDIVKGDDKELAKKILEYFKEFNEKK